MKWDLRTWEHKNLSSMFFLNQEINPATTSNPESKSKPRMKEHEHQRTWISNLQEKEKTKKKKTKKTWTSPNQKAWTKANTGKWRLTQTQEEHRIQNPGMRSQLRENQIAKMSPQTPDL